MCINDVLVNNHWNHLFVFIIQNGKRHIWRSYNLNGNLSTNCISSLVLDASSKNQPLQSSKDARFTYHFVRQNSLSTDSILDAGESFSVASSSASVLDSSLRVGDYVV